MKSYLNKLFLITLTTFLLMSKAEANNAEKASIAVQNMLNESRNHAINTIKLAPKLRTERIQSLVKKYINLEFMAKATTGPYWRSASLEDRMEYQKVLLTQIINTVEVHLNKLSTLTYRPIKTELRGKKLIYIHGIIEDSKKIEPPINILCKLASNDNGSFLILDLEIENVSLVSAQKSENMNILRKNKGNFKILIDTIK